MVNNKLVSFLSIVCLVCSFGFESAWAHDSPNSKGCVILLHGLARSALSMTRIERSLEQAGYRVVNQSYPSRKLPIEILAPKAINSGVSDCGDVTTIHFVTHSMGGILVRQYFSRHTLARLGRVVMLAPPNGGSELAEHFEFAQRWIGPALPQLVTHGDKSVPKKLGPVGFELGVIAGERSINPIMSRIIQGKDDGKVSVVNTRVEGMKSLIVLPVSHPFITFDVDAIEQTLLFLETGEFMLF